MNARRSMDVVTRSLGWRLVVALTGSLLLLLGVSGWLALELHRAHLYSLLERTAIEMGKALLEPLHLSLPFTFGNKWARAYDENGAYVAPCLQFSENQTCLDGLAYAHTVGDKQSRAV